MSETPPANPTEFHQQEAQRWQRLFADRERQRLDETQADYDAAYYELWVDVRNFAGHVITGHADIHGAALIPGFRNVVLNFCDTLTIDSVRGSAGQVLSYVRASQLLTVTLERDYAQNESFWLSVYYHGTPCLGGGIETFDWWNRPVSSYNVPSVASLSEPFGARDWWPCKDHPDDKADSMRMHIICADTLTGTSNGLLESVTTILPSSRQYNWFERNPISTYLVVVNASNFAKFTNWYVNGANDSLPLDYYVYPEKLTQSQVDFNIVAPAMAAFAERFGEYPFMDEKYGHTMFRWGGGMEHQCNTSLGRGLINGFHTFDWITVHELGHMWWGDMVTLADWPHVWLNEGFASYSEALWYEELGGSSGLVNYMVTNQAVTDPSGPIVNPGDLFDANTVYNKGAWVLHSLRGAINNDSLFFAGLREYRTRYLYGNATTEEFLDAMSDVAGFDVAPYANAYLYQTNRPVYRYSFGTGTVDGVLTTALRLRQTHASPPVPFTNRVEIRFTGSQTATVAAICSTYRQDYLYQLGFSPTTGAFDPNAWFLKTVLNEPLLPVILNGALTVGTENIAYFDTLVAIGGTGTYTFNLIGGSLPSGVTLAANGQFSGTPTVGGSFPLTLRVQDTNSQADTTNLVLTVMSVQLSPPEELTIVANTNDTVTLYWNSVSGATSYEILSAGQADYSDLTILTTVTDTTYTDTSLPAQKFYIVRANP